MSGLAIWSEGEKIDKTCACPYEVHFNLWTISKLYILDIGIKIKYVKELNNVSLYFPFELTKTSITDLGNVITSSSVLLNTVFNESYTMEEDIEPKQIIVKDSGTPIFYCYKLDIVTDISTRTEYNGTILTIDLNKKKLKENEMYYFRFRCATSKLNNFIEKRSNLNALNGLLTENDFIDFRLNDWRTLNNDSLREHVRNSKIRNYCLEKVNFFVMTNGNIEINSNTKKSERKLENDVWKDYIPINKNQVILAHQWQQKIDKQKGIMNVENFNAYLKFKKQWFNIATVFSYAILIIIINVISSIVAKFLLGGF